MKLAEIWSYSKCCWCSWGNEHLFMGDSLCRTIWQVLLKLKMHALYDRLIHLLEILIVCEKEEEEEEEEEGRDKWSSASDKANGVDKGRGGN